MKVYIDCLPCSMRQALEASRMATDNEDLQNRIMLDSLSVLCRYNEFSNSPEICREVHKIVKQYTGNGDPYKAVKDKDIKTALSLLPELKRIVGGEQDKTYWVLKAAATGNVLDSAIVLGLSFESRFEAELQKPFAVCDIELFKQKLKTAQKLLVIGDNAGETVFDCVLLEELGKKLEVIYAVRNGPILNDATKEDARASGIGSYAKIISSGCDVPGTMLSECSKEFLDIFYSSDIVISKGQGNFETLSDCDRDIFFLLKAKCAVISKLLSVSLNDYVFMHQENIK